jgi:hypothetical protein
MTPSEIARACCGPRWRVSAFLTSTYQLVFLCGIDDTDWWYQVDYDRFHIPFLRVPPPETNRPRWISRDDLPKDHAQTLINLARDRGRAQPGWQD